MAAIAFIGLWFREALNSLFQGLLIMIGNDINNDDILYISGRQARVVRVGLRKTIFYMTDRGTKMIVPNDRLKELTIEKSLPKNGHTVAKGPKVNKVKEVFNGEEFEEVRD